MSHFPQITSQETNILQSVYPTLRKLNLKQFKVKNTNMASEKLEPNISKVTQYNEKILLTGFRNNFYV